MIWNTDTISKTSEINYYKNEIDRLKIRNLELEFELDKLKKLNQDSDKYEKIPYWMRPDFKIEFTCSVK